MALRFLLLLPLLFILYPRRFEFLISILLAIIMFGTVGTILRQTLAAVPLMLFSGILLYVLLKWKDKEFIQKK